MVTLMVMEKDGMRHYAAINAGAKGRRFYGKTKAYPNGRLPTERVEDMEDFIAFTKTTLTEK